MEAKRHGCLLSALILTDNSVSQFKILIVAVLHLIKAMVVVNQNRSRRDSIKDIQTVPSVLRAGLLST
jgi:hypothetical protein